MRFELLNDLLIGNDIFKLSDVEGLGSADIRTSDFLYSGASGGMVADQFYGFRLITLTGQIWSNTCALHTQHRREFMDGTPIGQVIPLRITDFDGSEYIVFGNIVKPTDIKKLAGGTMSEFIITVQCGDPLFYSADGGDEQSANISRVAQGGYETPYILPVEWDSGSAPTIVNNSGNATVYPVITLNDSAINPSITNQVTGEVFALDMTMVDGDELIIDMFNRTVTLNGTNVVGNKTAESRWWGLTPGNNPIVLDSDSAGDNIAGTLVWKNGITGI